MGSLFCDSWICSYSRCKVGKGWLELPNKVLGLVHYISRSNIGRVEPDKIPRWLIEGGIDSFGFLRIYDVALSTKEKNMS